MLNLRKPVLVSSFLGSIFLLAWLNGVNPVLRFESEKVNLFFECVIYLLPLALVINGFRFKNHLIKLINILLLIVPALAGIFFFIVTFGWLLRDMNPRFHSEVYQSDDYTIRIIRGVGSAISLPTIHMRQEKKIGLSLVLVKTIYQARKYKSEVEIEKINEGELRFYDVDGKRQVISLKTNVYWN